MSIQITVNIPGDATDPTSSAGRVKGAIDWLHRGEDVTGPQTAAEYKAYVAGFLADCLRHEVKRVETAKRKAELATIEQIEVEHD